MNPRLGILGSGQLALYLCQAARNLGVHTCVLSEEAEVPAAVAADQLLVGALDDPALLESFIDSCDVVTFDKEDIPVASLERLSAAERAGQLHIHPGADILALIKDKGLQKSWLVEHGFPTLPFRLLEGQVTETQALRDEFGLPLVQKARTGGYDGRGVQILKTEEQLGQLWDNPSLVEPFLANSREIAVLLARDSAGNVQVYPVFGMDFDPRLNALDCVYTPADLSPELAAEAQDLGCRVVAALNGVGVFAIEMFISPDNELLVNEISPRVHNSGHLTMEAAEASQFEQHVRAVCGLPLAPIGEVRPAAMVNILYRETMRKRCPDAPRTDLSEQGDLALHWYGKPPGRDGRKMGHITALADSAGQAAKRARRALADLQKNKKDKETRAA